MDNRKFQHGSGIFGQEDELGQQHLTILGIWPTIKVNGQLSRDGKDGFSKPCFSMLNEKPKTSRKIKKHSFLVF